MNTQIQAAFDHALLAYAAYSTFNQVASNSTLIGVLTSGDEPWPTALATYLADRYEVIMTHDSTGYNGVLFKGTATDNQGRYVFANRGTQFDFKNAFIETSLDLAADLQLATTGMNHQISAMQTFFEQALVKVNGNPLTVTGHSLGGYLSLILQNTHVSNINIDNTYTFNGAGLFNIALIPSIVNTALQALGYEPITVSSYLPVDNYYTVEGLTVTAATGVYGGVRVPVYSDRGGHGIDNLVDSLAVYNLLGMVDSDITLEELNAIHEAMSKDSLVENDALVKAFGSLLNKVFNWELDTDINAVSSDNNAMHKAIYEMVKKLQNAPQALQITPLVSFNESGQLQLHTNQDINSLAYRYALKELNPFIVEGINYSSFNQSGQLDDYNEGGAANDTSYRLAA